LSVWSSAEGWHSFSLECVPKFLSAIVEWDWGMAALLRTGQRIANMRHIFNLREDVNALDP
jgi:hypothetical protein